MQREIWSLKDRAKMRTGCMKKFSAAAFICSLVRNCVLDQQYVIIQILLTRFPAAPRSSSIFRKTMPIHRCPPLPAQNKRI